MVNVLVTNGTIEEVPWRALLPLIDAANIDLKGFTLEWYQRVPGGNDCVEEVRALARWMASVDREILLHLSRFFPRYRMSNRPPTPVEQVYRFADETKAYIVCSHGELLIASRVSGTV
ncbi:hypothetical protein [uncultured Dysosmobacter sp.]|uniref:hypothetical protein n=1 Tax=uncultured Dysosmobacter sp. TaxID=2591384 RepID=UPI002628E67C|nr:hypothetical protein [uncultured Dysosmobacter sp.]